jgi:hypothetical protein
MLHKRFTDKTLNHITYSDKELWDSPNDALKQKILSDAEKNKNKDFAQIPVKHLIESNYVYYSAYQHSVDL